MGSVLCSTHEINSLFHRGTIDRAATFSQKLALLSCPPEALALWHMRSLLYPVSYTGTGAHWCLLIQVNCHCVVGASKFIYDS